MPRHRAPRLSVRGCFVTGTDTGVGKTVVTAAIIAVLRAAGERVRPLKPVITGLDDPADPVWPPDHELLARVAGCQPGEVSPIGFGPAVSPHLAAELAGEQLDPSRLRALVREAVGATADGVLVIEGVGGLLAPIAPGFDVRRLAADAGLPVVVAARPGLGTINHTLLTLEAARTAGLTVRGVVMTPWPRDPDVMTRSNRETIARLGGLAVSTLAAVESPEPERLAWAGAELPIDEWIAPIV